MKEHGTEIYNLVSSLFPICRSITGDGVRESLKIISKSIPLKITEVPSGTKCFDWVVPAEWNIRGAFIADPDGKRVIDFRKNNLHVIGYSEPVKCDLTLEELKSHLHFDENHPEAIPYLTSYYQRRWGFCLSKRSFDRLKKGTYHVEIDSSFNEKGSLTYAEAFIPGKRRKEIVFSSYICHPSMANDSLSGVALTVKLCEYIMKRGGSHYSYRFLFVPETIGSIAYLSKNRTRMMRDTYCGMVLTCLGDNGNFLYKRTRCWHELDKITENILKFSGHPYGTVDFFPSGSDERQYSSPGFNLPFGSLTRSLYGKFPEYHTSADDLDFVNAKSMGETFDMYTGIIEALEYNGFYVNRKPFCEPFLSKYGLYSTLGSQKYGQVGTTEILYVLNFSDGNTSLADIAGKMNQPISKIIGTARLLEEKGLIGRKNNSQK